MWPYTLGSMGIFKSFKELEAVNDAEEWKMDTPHIFASSSYHYSVRKACSVIGLGAEAIELIPTDENCRIDIEKLQARLE